VIVKHANPCGVATAATRRRRLRGARIATDPTSAFGGIIAFNRPLDARDRRGHDRAASSSRCCIAPDFTPRRVAVLAAKPNVRVLETRRPAGDHGAERRHQAASAAACWCRPATLGMSRRDDADGRHARASRRTPSCDDLLFAWQVAQVREVERHRLLPATAATLGIGAGQMSRVDSSPHRRASKADAREARGAPARSVASDAFFPFRDGLDVRGRVRRAAAVIQPGGSMRDAEVIAAANEHGMADGVHRHAALPPLSAADAHA
jgi:phosphoribosylaminoimidazolecarboxamide formyltransferase/IMP cyclohydrolase